MFELAWRRPSWGFLFVVGFVVVVVVVFFIFLYHPLFFSAAVICTVHCLTWDFPMRTSILVSFS